MKRIALVVVLIASFLMICGMDYQDELDHQELYCEMVDSGAWGAYDNQINCSK